MMVFSFLFVVLTLPRISLLVNAFLKIIEKSKIFKMDSQKKKPRSSLSFSLLLC
ncbi:sugar transferase [Streptococcus parasanguinis]|nr:sugar transferase [Streptococcus parasanguinis]